MDMISFQIRRICKRYLWIPMDFCLFLRLFSTWWSPTRGLLNFFYYFSTDTRERSVCERGTLSPDYGRWQPALKFFLRVQRVQSSIICPRCHKLCHNMIMRLHTFGGDSCGKTRAVGNDGTNVQAWNDYHSLLQSGRRSSGARTAEKPRSHAGRTDFYAQRYRII